MGLGWPVLKRSVPRSHCEHQGYLHPGHAALEHRPPRVQAHQNGPVRDSLRIPFLTFNDTLFILIHYFFPTVEGKPRLGSISITESASLAPRRACMATLG